MVSKESQNSKRHFKYIRTKQRKKYEKDWWDENFYTKGVSDRKTISPRKSSISAKYHYNSVELKILQHIRNKKVRVKEASVLDIGSGSGHWIDFYKEMGAKSIIGVDLSETSVSHLKNKYKKQKEVDIYHDDAIGTLDNQKEKLDIVNAIGVMFHIVDDVEWKETIEYVGSKLKKNGIFVVGGHFGLVDGINVQIDNHGNINKRLRSKRRWKKILYQNEFKNVSIYKNKAYLYIDDSLPENNLLVARK